MDLIKINVEGHAPLVLKGMQKTIGRSPNIRNLSRICRSVLSQYGRRRLLRRGNREFGFQDLPRNAGFRLEPVERGQKLRGAHYCWLTRTPQSDIAHVRDAARRWPTRLAKAIRRLEAKWDKYRHGLHRI